MIKNKNIFWNRLFFRGKMHKPLYLQGFQAKKTNLKKVTFRVDTIRNIAYNGRQQKS